MEFIATDFGDAWVIKPKVFNDSRGFFLESYSAREFADHGIFCAFVQDNHSLSKEAGVLRGLHFQLPPREQAKLIRAIRGSIFDVIVDLRRGSPTYRKWQGFTLSADNFLMLYVPRGFAHGFCTLERDAEIVYKVDNYYSADHDSGVAWNDPDLAVDWPVKNPILSNKDRTLKPLAAFDTPFRYA
jgi:dTDP-4-dehydrorhamnose 3,5-epimerase